MRHHVTDSDADYDVLFVSSAGRQTVAGKAAFETFVERLIDISPETIEPTIKAAITMAADRSETASALNSRGATDWIVETVIDTEN